jgi:Hydantoin racemase
MKITVIAPIALKRKSTYESKPCCQSLPCDFDFVFIDEGPMLILNAYDQAFASPGVVLKAQEAEANGADAIIINCTADTALYACREAVSIPVIGAAESTFLFTAQFTDQITVLTFSDRINGRFYDIARNLGMSHRLTCSRTVSLPEGSGKGKDDVVNALYENIKDIYDHTRCDSFMLGCSDFEGMGHMMGCPGVAGIDEGLKAKLSENSLKVYLYKPFDVAVNQAYIAALMHARSSRKTYPAPHTIYNKGEKS